MNVSILSVFPELYGPFLGTSLIKRAQEKGLISVNLSSFFSYVAPRERIDEPTFGHGAGMLIKPEVVQKAIEDAQTQRGTALKIFFSPHGKKLDQQLLSDLAKKVQTTNHLMLVAGRYEGMDARVEQHYADELISLGDFVLMGGDLPAMVLLEGLLRLMPGVVGKQESVEHESFTGPFVDYPEYTAPVVWQGMQVPDVVRSGNHGELIKWRLQQAVERTVYGHFQWIKEHPLTSEQKKMVLETMPPHYVALSHTDVLIGRQEKQEGTTSVTSIDIHDIARSSATYGIKNFFIVTPLLDQQRVVEVLLEFWQKGVGVEYNKNRHEAVKSVRLMDSLEQTIAEITQKEGVAPLVIVTSARENHQQERITFYDQAKVWALKRPLLFVFGTGQGLSQSCIEKADYLLVPVQGLTEFRHLSVRSAVAIILDRWMGLSFTQPH